MRAISNQIADTSDPTARDELLSQLMLFQGSLFLLTLASVCEDHLFLQRADRGSVLNILAIPNEQIASVQHRVTCVTDDSFLSLLDKIASSAS